MDLEIVLSVVAGALSVVLAGGLGSWIVWLYRRARQRRLGRIFLADRIRRNTQAPLLAGERPSIPEAHQGGFDGWAAWQALQRAQRVQQHWQTQPHATPQPRTTHAPQPRTTHAPRPMPQRLYGAPAPATRPVAAG